MSARRLARSNWMDRARVLVACCGIAAGWGMGASAMGQGKPSAAPIENPTALREPDVAGFGRAYERDDRPTMLVLVGWANSQHQANDPANTLFNNDPTGITQQIKSAIEEVLNAPEADAELVNINALRASNERLRGVLATRGERDAVELIADDLSAQMVLMVKLHGVGADGGIGKATVEAFRADRARTLFTIAFDWKGGTTAKELKINGRQIARAFIDDYARRLSGESRRITLNVLGVSDTADIRAAREVIEEVAGVDRVRRRSTAATRRDAIAQFEVTYMGTDATTLADDAAYALEGLFGRLEMVKDEGGAITLRPTGQGGRVGFDDINCIRDMAEDSAAGDAVRADLQAFARANGNPRVVVLINREAPFADAEIPAEATGSTTASNMVVISLAERDAIAVGANGAAGGDRAVLESRRREAALQARLIEDALSDQMGAGLLGLRVVDADTVRARLIAAVDAKNRDMSDGSAKVSEAQLAAMLRSENLADIIVTGVARVRPEGAREPSATYTFRAVDARTAEVLGAAAIATPLSLNADAPRVEAVATDAAATLGCKILRSWIVAGSQRRDSGAGERVETRSAAPVRKAAAPSDPVATPAAAPVPAPATGPGSSPTAEPELVPVPPKNR